MATPRKLTEIQRLSSEKKPSVATATPYETIILDSTGAPVDSPARSSPFVSALCYKGLEVVLASHDQYIEIILTRSRMTLQRLKVHGSIVGIYANPVNGIISVVTSSRKVYNFNPVPTKQSGKSTNRQPVTVFGKYFWIKARTVDCTTLFNEDVPFKLNSNSATVHIGSSIDYKLLIAHADQIAIFDISPHDEEYLDIKPKEEDIMERREGEILWTTRVRATISHAVISGDGRSIAYVLHGEGIGVPYPFGVRTFVRDKEDGSNENRSTYSKPPRPDSSQNRANEGKDKDSKRSGGITPPPFPTMDGESVYDYPDVPDVLMEDDIAKKNLGIVYKAGSFLVHSTTVSRLSFRGQGLNHSCVYHDDTSGNTHGGIRDGNDLLLTCCSSDGSFRVFSQGSWKMLFHWDTPPGSRADWIHGITMANLGDLDPLSKNNSRKSNASAMNAANNLQNTRGEVTTANITTPQRSKKDHTEKVNQTRNAAANSSGWQSQLVPNSAAGAWISEITFRGPYPALRLSRLSFLKSSGDSWAPAHFDSVGTILPPATILPQDVLHNLESMSMTVQGIWSAWNPWIAHPGSGGNVVEDESLSGNALALLGSVPQGHGVSSSGTDATVFGTHSPPAELRIVASHIGDKVGIIEFPLWGDTDFGAMQLGSPLKYLLSLKENLPDDICILNDKDKKVFAPLPVTVSTRCECLNFESSSLCARVTENKKHISLEWRKKGTMNAVSYENENSPSVPSSTLHREDSDISIGTTVSQDSEDSHASFDQSHDSIMKQFSDLSISPLPLSLPALHLPVTADAKEYISLLKWWPDENFGGPPRLFALTSEGTLILYEMPPPWSALEPIAPDPYAINIMGSSTHSEQGSSLDRDSFDCGLEESIHEEMETTYEAQLTPHPDFGLGLRLEAQTNGMPAVAGSYKKHPVTGGRLPAERTGKIVLGDELVLVNGVSLEGLTFDDIIATVRKVSTAAEGGPLTMQFRALQRNRILRENLSNLTSDQVSIEEGLEVVHTRSGNAGENSSVLGGASGETQQEFGRIVATIANALPSYSRSPRSLALLPWHYGKGAPKPYEVRGAALLVSAIGRKITASRLEVLNGYEPETNGKLSLLGSTQLEGESDIVSLVYIRTASNGWCVGACDCDGEFQLIFIDIKEDKSSLLLSASFRSNVILKKLCGDERSNNCPAEYLVRAASVEVLASMPMGGTCNTVSVWSSALFVSSTRHKSEVDRDLPSSYTLNKISHRGKLEGDLQPILDFRWVVGGTVDAFPWLVTFSESSAVVHCRRGDHPSWVPVAELFYSVTKEICGESGVKKQLHSTFLAPVDSTPHLLTTLRNIVSVTDERKLLLSDWHPESLLALLCSERDGPKTALTKHVKGIMLWLSEWMDSDDTMNMHWDSYSHLSSAPFNALYGSNNEEDSNSDGNEMNGENAVGIFQTVVNKSKKMNKEDLQFQKLQKCLQCAFTAKTEAEEGKDALKNKFSKEFLATMTYNKKDSSNANSASGDALPDPICNLSTDELFFLWCMGEICRDPPNFEGLDRAAQLTILSATIVRQIKSSNYSASKETSLRHPMHDLQGSFFMKKKTSSNFSDKKALAQPITIASSACLAALLSDTQNKLLIVCKPEGKWTWDAARSLNLPFWLRSDDELKRISEEIAQQTYKNKLEVVEAALFYVITGNMRMLKTLAAADRNHTGRTFLKFITRYDFSSTKGRTAAEKNAFSLLRKRKYGPAAAFFLLAEPPMLKNALNIIVTKMEDPALALFVSRLVDVNRSTKTAVAGDSLTIGNAFSLNGFGGGGGFASQGSGFGTPSADIEETRFCDWDPKLSKLSRDFLESQSLPRKLEDSCLLCVQLLWLNRPNDAVLGLIGATLDRGKDPVLDTFKFETLPPAFRADDTIDKDLNATGRIISKINSMIDFASKPLIVERMNLPEHVIWFVSLATSRALCRRGIEIPSILTLPAVGVDEPPAEESAELKLRSTNVADRSESSILYSFDAAPAPKSNSNLEKSQSVSIGSPDYGNSTGQTASSIFDSFDTVPPPKPKKVLLDTSSGGMASSIFDSFDTVPPRKPKMVPADTSSGGMASSIFDSFDTVPPPKSEKVPVDTSSGGMASSIFDSFDTVPPPKSKKVPVDTSSGGMSSSIFDSFDTVPPPKPEKVPAVTSSGGMASSVLTSAQPKITVSSTCRNKEEEEIIEDSEIMNVPIPPVWIEWKQNILTSSVARRLLREMARIIIPFLGDMNTTSMALFRRHVHPLISYGAAHVFQEACEGGTILSILVDVLDDLCSKFYVSKAPVVEHALRILGCPHQPQRIVFAVLLHCLTGRADLAEDVMRDAANDQIRRCEGLVSANDDLVHSRKTKFHSSSQYTRRQSVNVSFQLELCLWLHRGGVFPMSGLAVKETTVGVRIGYIVASWGRCHEALETLLKCDPDCAMDFERGRQLWSSMKMILSGSDGEDENDDGATTTSGGWEFLVDCSRVKATELLRSRKCGSFLLRPNPDDHGIFTLSFRTNMKLKEGCESEEIENSELSSDAQISSSPSAKLRQWDDVVQHAIIRLSDAGFKCGSFGPFSSLLKLLDSVSNSLPFDLLFSEPPAQGIIKEEGGQPSPNSVFVRKLALHSNTEHYRWNASTGRPTIAPRQNSNEEDIPSDNVMKKADSFIQQTEQEKAEFERSKQLGLFSQLLVVTELRKQLCAMVAAPITKFDEQATWEETKNNVPSASLFDGSIAGSIEEAGEIEMDAVSSRMIRPFLSWCRSLETSIVGDLLPMLDEISQRPASSLPVSLSASATAIEAVPTQIGSSVDCGDAIIRKMIQPRSGVEFRTLRVGEAGHSAVVVLFRRSQAISWIIRSGAEMNEGDAAKRLQIMERHRVIERVDLNSIAYEKQVDAEHNEFTENDNDVRYRFVDPWEVEVLESKDAELRGASLGRQHYTPFTIGAVARACEESQRHLGGLHLLSLWSSARGGVGLTKAIASVYPPWERDAGGDLQVSHGAETQPSTYANCFRQHLYRNTLFHRLNLPQRFIAILQVEILDLKNLTAPGGSPSVTAYALLRLKRDASNAPLTHKARTLDSASTEPRKINKSSGPNAPASWGSVVRFRFPLPEGVNCDGVSFDSDREALFKGAPSVLQISVYEKKFMTNSALGGADVKLDALSTSGQLEEWVPLVSTKDDITWFARLRLTLRFELMCLASKESSISMDLDHQCPSAGLRKMKVLSRIGGAHEDANGVPRAVSSPDIVTYFEHMVS
eukprot:scaffold7259_cov267-Chaetoceros_neogracile.AAC.13